MTAERAGHLAPAVEEQHVHFRTAGTKSLVLEGKLASAIHPPEDASERMPIAVLCHPQPLTSSMEDPLTARIAHDLARAGFLALRFNFRGVGASQGEPTEGRFEPLDLAGAAAYLLAHPQADPQRLCLIGHAFGAYVALVYAAADSRVGAVAAISLPVYRITPDLARFERPRVFITAEHDEVSPQHKLVPWIEQLPGTRHLKVLSGARHLMRGSEATASTTVVQYLIRWARLPEV